MSRVIPNGKQLIQQRGNLLAAVAHGALRMRGFPTAPRLCQRFVRMVIQAAYGRRYDRYHGATAEQSRHLWSASPYAVDPSRGSVIGDILYKRGTPSNPAGHVGIRIAGNRVAENSTVHGGDGDARGTRSLDEFGKVDLIVRLPNLGY